MSIPWSQVESSCRRYLVGQEPVPTHEQVDETYLQFYFRYIQSQIVNIDDPHINGEYTFYKTIAPFCKHIVDVGVRNDIFYIEQARPNTNLYLFEPNPVFFRSLEETIQSSSQTKEKHIHLYNEGCSDKEATLHYYGRAESFVNRFGETPSQSLLVKRLDSKPELQSLSRIEFCKIDTEGFELDVLRGAEGILQKIYLVQFEYGGTYPDRKIQLVDVIRQLQKYHFHYFYYIFKDGLFKLDASNPLEHKQYCNILASKFPFDY